MKCVEQAHILLKLCSLEVHLVFSLLSLFLNKTETHKVESTRRKLRKGRSVLWRSPVFIPFLFLFIRLLNIWYGYSEEMPHIT